MAEATNKVYYCPIELSLDLVGSRWKPTLLRHLGEGVYTVGDLHCRMPLVTRKALDGLLLELVQDGIVSKTLHSDERDREEYCLTDDGQALRPILDQLALLGREYAQRRGIELIENEPDLVSAGAANEERWLAWSWLPL